MKRERIGIGLITILTVLLFVGCNDDPPHHLGPAPSLAIQNLQSGLIQGKSVFRGKPLVIDFWASWCEPCRELMPKMSSLATSYKGKVNVIGISAENPDQIKKFWASTGNKYSAYADQNGFTFKNYHVNYIPTVAIIDAKGNLVFEVTEPSMNRVRKMLNALLGIKRA